MEVKGQGDIMDTSEYRKDNRKIVIFDDLFSNSLIMREVITQLCGLIYFDNR